MTLSLEHANHILRVALESARSEGFRPMGVVVVDASGAIKASAREDGASPLRLDIALGKAYAAVNMGVDSRELGLRAKDNPNFFVALAATAQGKFLPQTGAVVIRDAAGELIGAAGASGGTGDEDELICHRGVLAAGLKR